MLTLVVLNVILMSASMLSVCQQNVTLIDFNLIYVIFLTATILNDNYTE